MFKKNTVQIHVYNLIMAGTCSVKPAPSVLCIWPGWLDQLPGEGDGSVQDRGTIRGQLHPVVGQQESGEEKQQEEGGGGRGEGELGHGRPLPHRGEGRGITVRRIWNLRPIRNFCTTEQKKENNAGRAYVLIEIHRSAAVLVSGTQCVDFNHVLFCTG